RLAGSPKEQAGRGRCKGDRRDDNGRRRQATYLSNGGNGLLNVGQSGPCDPKRFVVVAGDPGPDQVELPPGTTFPRADRARALVLRLLDSLLGAEGLPDGLPIAERDPASACSFVHPPLLGAEARSRRMRRRNHSRPRKSRSFVVFTDTPVT